MTPAADTSVTWTGHTLPTAAAASWGECISLGGPGGAAEGVLVSVSAKLQIQAYV